MNVETLYFLADFSLTSGLIGLDEHRERIEVAHWMSTAENDPDPRMPREGVEAKRRPEVEEASLEPQAEESRTHQGPERTDPPLLELIKLKVWYFTIGDADCYPSVPHGHHSSENRAWPKLNPYTGRVFEQVHREKCSMRLSKAEMRELWTDVAFKGHCRKQILWYLENHSNYMFPVRNPLRLPRW